MIRRFTILAVASSAVALCFAAPADARPQWTAAQAQSWYAHQPWLVGSDYVPRTAINQLEMWQPATFDPATIDQEFGWAQAMGMNTMRVFLHNVAWEEDAPGFKARIDQFLTIAARHHIRPVFVLFDSCWEPDPHPGPQHPPIPGVHNSGWVQSPGFARLADAGRYPQLQAYVKDVVGSFARDPRILAWDLWNEPDNEGGDPKERAPEKERLVTQLIGQVYDWAEAADPTQPLTSGVWKGEHWDQPATLNAIEKVQLTRSDVNSFHDYSWPETFAARARQMVSLGRPVLCTEYMARGAGSTFDGDLPIAKTLNIAVINWGFVDGKTQTRLPWNSWQRPYTLDQPTIWFHDVLHADGTPYRQAEVDMIRAYTSAPKGVVPAAARPGFVPRGTGLWARITFRRNRRRRRGRSGS